MLIFSFFLPHKMQSLSLCLSNSSCVFWNPFHPAFSRNMFNWLFSFSLKFLILKNFWLSWVASLVAQVVINLPEIQETRIRSLGREDSPGEGNGYPLKYSCLENSMDRGAWWAKSMRSQGVRYDWATNTLLLKYSYSSTNSKLYWNITQFLSSAGLI